MSCEWGKGCRTWSIGGPGTTAQVQFTLNKDPGLVSYLKINR